MSNTPGTRVHVTAGENAGRIGVIVQPEVAAWTHMMCEPARSLLTGKPGFAIVRLDGESENVLVESGSLAPDAP